MCGYHGDHNAPLAAALTWFLIFVLFTLYSFDCQTSAFVCSDSYKTPKFLMSFRDENVGCFGGSLEVLDVLVGCWKFWLFWAVAGNFGYFEWSLEVFDVLSIRWKFWLF